MQDETKHRGFEGAYTIPTKLHFLLHFLAVFSAFSPHFPAFFARTADRIIPPPPPTDITSFSLLSYTHPILPSSVRFSLKETSWITA